MSRGSGEGCSEPVAESVRVIACAVVFPSKTRRVLAGREAKQFEEEVVHSPPLPPCVMLC